MIVYEYVDKEGKTVGVDNLDDDVDILSPDAIEVVSRGTHIMKRVKQEPTVVDSQITVGLALHGLYDCGFRGESPESVAYLTRFTRNGLKAYVDSFSADPGAMFGDTNKKRAYYFNDWLGQHPEFTEWERKEVSVDSGSVKDAEVYVGGTLLTNGHYFASGCEYPAPLTSAVGYWRWTD